MIFCLPLVYTLCRVSQQSWYHHVPHFSLGTLEKYGIRIKSAYNTGSEGQHQPCSCSHQNRCYIGYTSTRLHMHSCVLMQKATTFNIFYDGISFQHLATVLISVFTLCYGPGLLFRGPSYTLEFMKQLYTKLIKYLNKFQNSYSKLKPYTIILSFTIFSSSQAHLRFPSHFFQTFLLFLVTINFSFTLPSIYILNNSCTLQYRDHLVLSAKYIQ